MKKALLTGLFYLFITNIFATNWIVTNNLDSGSGSLRSMIDSSQANDTISFDPSLTYGGNKTITLSSVIQINHSLTIIGMYNLSDSLFISASNSNALRASDNLHLEKVLFKNITNTPTSGGVVYFYGDSLWVNNCTFTNCYTDSLGGAIFCNNNNYLSVSNSTFNEITTFRDGGVIATKYCPYVELTNVDIKNSGANNSHNGGGLYVFRGNQLHINNSSFKNMHASLGGAVYFLGDTLNVNHTYFENCVVDQVGGAICITNDINNDGIAEYNYCTFKNDTSLTSAGGAVYSNRIDSVVYRNCIVENCYARIGGGFNVSDGSAYLYNSEFNNNTTSGIGSAFFMRGILKLNHFEVKNSNFNGNSSGYGNDLFEGGTLCVEDSVAGTIYQCNFNNNVSNGGGGAIAKHGNGKGNNIISIYESNFTNNIGRYGGAIISYGDTLILNVDHCNFYGNVSNNGGGAIYEGSTTKSNFHTTITNCNFIQNSAGSGDGGAILTGGILTVKDNLFRGNSSTNGNGGAIAIVGFTNASTANDLENVTLKNITFEQNQTTGNGGALYLYSSLLAANAWNYSQHLDSCYFTGNQSGDAGGGAYFEVPTNLYISNADFISNSANTFAGALSITVSKGYLNNLKAYSNTATSQGGALVIGGGTYAIVTNATLTNNSGQKASAAYSSGSLVFKNSTISYNKSSMDGALELQGADTLLNVTMIGNSNTTGNYCDEIRGNNYKIGSSIIVDSNPLHNFIGTVTSLGNNIFSDTVVTNSVASDVLGADSLMINLSDLRYNGGSTETYMPLPGSIALDSGNPIDFQDAQNGPITDTRRDVGSAEYTCNTYNYIDTLFCGSTFTSISGNYAWTLNGVYFDTIPNSSGCDSVFRYNIHFMSDFVSQTLYECDSLVSPSGNTVWHSSGVYHDTLTNIYGCDSVIEINLTISNSSFQSTSVVACDHYQSQTGNIYSVTGVYYDTLTTVNFCDSIFETSLTINHSTSSSISVNECSSYTSPSGNYVWTTSGNYTDVIVNSVGCDSLISINLTVQPQMISTIGFSEGTISSNEPNAANYQWLDCNNGMTAIPGANTRYYYTGLNGTYAVELTSSTGCVDTTNCVTVGDNSLAFDGINDIVQDGYDINHLLGNNKLTVELWAYPEQFGSTAQNNVLYTARVGAGSGTDVSFEVSTGNSGQVRFYIGNTTTGNQIITPQNTITLNTWHHIASTYDNGMMRLYVDGVKVDSLTSSIVLDTLSSYNQMGASYGISNPFKGRLDEVRIWNSCRTESEIVADMNYTLCSYPPDLIRYWDFNLGIANGDNTGTTYSLHDRTSTSAAAFLYNFAYIGTSSNFVNGTPVVGAANDTIYDTVSTCGDYISPSGLYTWTNSGNYIDSITNSCGGQTIYIINLTISGPQAVIQSVDNGGGSFDFTNISTGNYNKTYWMFGDGNDANVDTTSNQYPADGNYTVVLGVQDTTASGNGCIDYAHKDIIVSGVTNPVTCNAGFSVYPDTVSNSLIVINSSTGSNLSYFWDFGDTITSTLANPTHVYNTNGPYQLCLTIDNGMGCTDSYCDSISNAGPAFRQSGSGFTINVYNVNNTTGISDNDAQSLFIFPNPVKDVAHIVGDILAIEKITVLDNLGRVVKCYNTPVTNINLSNISSGTYFILIRTDQQVITKKIIKN